MIIIDTHGKSTRDDWTLQVLSPDAYRDTATIPLPVHLVCRAVLDAFPEIIDRLAEHDLICVAGQGDDRLFADRHLVGLALADSPA